MKPTIRGIIFDMDGTLVEPAIDFTAMRQAIGVLEGDILLTLEGWEAEARERALSTIRDIERAAARSMQLVPGTRALMRWMDERGLARALVTRNNAETIETLGAHLDARFAPAIDRSFRPLKPDPAALLHICETWQLAPEQVLMVGDSRQDMGAARRAGTSFCLVEQPYNEPWRHECAWCVERLDAIAERLGRFNR